MKILKLLLLITFFLNAGFDSAKNKKSQFLSPEEAFKVSAEVNGDVIETKIILGDKIHISDSSLKYKIIKPKQFELNVKRPKGHIINGELSYTKEVAVDIPISQITSHDINGSFTLKIELEGCSDGGICYNPVEKEFNLKVPEPSFFTKLKSLLDESNSANIVDVLIHESSIFIILLFFIFGVLLSLTPCIFPMIPILSSIIVSQAGKERPTPLKGFITSLIYVLSMAITYTLVGVISGLIGADIQSAMQSPYMFFTFAVIFFALALSLFGYYEIQLPASWQSKINAISDNAQGKGIISTAIMGFLSAFVIGPCVAPPLAGAVLFISKTGDALLGGTALFAMSIGMGLPLMLIGIGAGKFMPKPGGWMSSVSKTFGIIMLGVSIFMIGKIVPAWLETLLWSLLFIGTALYMGVFDSNRYKGAFRLFQILAFIFLLYGSSLFIGLLSGNYSMLRPFEKFTQPKVVAQNTLTTQTTPHKKTIKETSALGYSIERLLKEVKESKKPVIVDINKQSCPSCRELENITFVDPKVKKELERFTFISVDITKNTPEDRAILKKYELMGTPNIIFFDKDNNFLRKKSLTGYVPPEKFLKHLQSIK
jgi:thiol:disulfide interchange protein DsbD